MSQLAALARSYTPEWRYEGAEDDPGAALAELFGEMFYQTVDRMNSVPGKLHTEFLNTPGDAGAAECMGAAIGFERVQDVAEIVRLLQAEVEVGFQVHKLPCTGGIRAVFGNPAAEFP